MSFKEAWSGDWHDRILERVRQRGFQTVTQYADERPLDSLYVLAKDLGMEDIAAVQVRSLLIEEGIRTRTLPRTSSRSARSRATRGPSRGLEAPLDDATGSEVVGVLVRWRTLSEIGDNLDCFDRESTFKAGRDFMQAELPTGWLPEGPDDPVIITFVDRCLGRALP